jgi:class 3 adenylate cyclase/tetratricopeptide (TPR) repeat protein
MRCPKCEFDNPRGMKFCGKCRTPLAQTCPDCAFENPPGFDFCGQCAAALSPPVRGPVFASAPVSASTGEPTEVVGERRHLTVLFCDLVGSTAIAGRLDPEQWRETVAGYHRAAAEAITRFEGHVAKYLGDGVMAYFGWPAAHDNDAERAARAGLAILDAITKLNQQPGHAQLSARVGIDSGTVVIDKGTRNEAEVFGDVPNIAARVQTIAQPGTVAITDATHRLVSGLFVVEDCGARELKGIERPLQLYRVVRPSGMRGRFPAMAAMRGMTPFVGREDELRSLLNRWERVREGEGQVVTIIGEGGIGKSRLVQRFREELAAAPYTWLECATAPFFQNTPFYAVADMMQQSFHWEASHTVDQRLASLEASLVLAGLDPDEAVPLIAPLLELPVGTRYPPLSMALDQQRKRLLATLVGWTFGAAKAQPLVIATEDLHWADPSTLELTQLVVEQGAHARLLLLYTARPEFRAPWPMRAHHTQINLNRLTTRNVRTMVAQVAAKIALSDETVATVVARTGGVPLFVEELTRAVLESGEVKLSGREIPATLHDSLMARLDRLGPAKEVIQVGAVIGSEFSYGLLHAVHPIGEADLQAALRSLGDAELLYVRGIAPDATYQFKHALIRDAAYGALLKSRRKELHLMVARTIDEKFPTLKEAHPEVLARHWTEAGETDSAVTEWSRAGQRAVEKRAFIEGEQQYRTALANLQSLPESADRGTRELTLQVALGNVMSATRGWSAVETAEVYAQARLLAERGGDAESLQVFNGLRTAAVTRGELRSALALGEQMLEIARVIDTPTAFITAHQAHGNTQYYLGDLVGARHNLQSAVALWRVGGFRGALTNLVEVSGLVWSGLNEWMLGCPDSALKLVDEGISLAHRQNNPFGLAVALSIGGHVPSFRGEYKRVVDASEEALRIGIESGLRLTNAISKIRGAWALAHMGETADTINRIQMVLTEFNAMKFHVARSLYLCLLAEVQALVGEVDGALVTVEQALQANPDELFYRPEALRLRGELRLKQDDTESAEADFRDAIALAQSMSAKAWELRATTSLAHLLRDTGHRDEARTMLADIYNWFTEGFDTADLKDARTLLEELST